MSGEVGIRFEEVLGVTVQDLADTTFCIISTAGRYGIGDITPLVDHECHLSGWEHDLGHHRVVDFNQQGSDEINDRVLRAGSQGCMEASDESTDAHPILGIGERGVSDNLADDRNCMSVLTFSCDPGKQRFDVAPCTGNVGVGRVAELKMEAHRIGQVLRPCSSNSWAATRSRLHDHNAVGFEKAYGFAIGGPSNFELLHHDLLRGKHVTHCEALVTDPIHDLLSEHLPLFGTAYRSV